MAEQLPATLGTELLDASREAFMQGMRASTDRRDGRGGRRSAVLAVTMLRHVRSGAETEAAGEAASAQAREPLEGAVAVE